MNKTYFAYTRVSTVKQGERGSSLTEQKSAIAAYAERSGLKVTEWFEEVETAAKQGRRRFTKMLSALRTGAADGLIIHKIDRSARNLRDWADLGDLIDRGVDVRFVSDNFDLLSRGGRLSADIQAVVAADYIRNLREEVKKGMWGRLKQGLYPWAAPAGYLNTGKGQVKVIDPLKGPLVRYLFERYASNTVGFHALRQEVFRMGLKTSTGTPLYVNSLTHILNNPFYMGVIRLKSTGETFDGVHEPLVSKAVFERVQAILRGKTVPRTKKHKFLLSGLVRCHGCNRRALIGEKQKGRVYYRCHSVECRGTSWRGEVLEAIVLRHIERIRLSDREIGDVGDIVRDHSRSEHGDRERYRSATLLRLQKLEARSTRLTDLLIDEAIDQATYNARKEALLMERRGILEERQALESCTPLEGLLQKFELKNRELLRYETLSGDEKRELIEIIGSNFAVSGKSSTFTLRTPYREIAELDNSQECAHHRDDVRTFHIVEILKSVAEGQGDKLGTTSPTSPCPPNEQRRHA